MRGSFVPIHKKWQNHLWIISLIYFSLGFFNILFALLGFICVLTPIIQASFTNNKSFCYNGCPRSKLFELIGGRFKLSRNKVPPKFLISPWFRNTFMILFFGGFFSTFCTILWQIQGQPIRESIVGLWQFYFPWMLRDIGKVPPQLALMAMASYSAMFTSLILGTLSTILYRPRTWCAYCPMGTLTQNICKDNAKEEAKKIAKAVAQQQNTKEEDAQ